MCSFLAMGSKITLFYFIIIIIYFFYSCFSQSGTLFTKTCPRLTKTLFHLTILTLHSSFAPRILYFTVTVTKAYLSFYPPVSSSDCKFRLSSDRCPPCCHWTSPKAMVSRKSKTFCLQRVIDNGNQSEILLTVRWLTRGPFVLVCVFLIFPCSPTTI